jgi:MYXO-CTERM domain-containing protein
MGLAYGPGMTKLHAGRWLVRALAVAALVTLLPHDAAAHFVLDEPASAGEQDALGSPQKLGPCGDESGGGPTGEITAYQSGDTISITIHETIFHPGHYRIALSVNDRSELPEEPIVTAGSTPCGSVPIMDPPVFPVLADGVLIHTEPFSGPQTFEVTLPADVTCTHCTLQVIEFMSNHGLNVPGGCFYHHCADISISEVAVDVDSGTTPGVDSGTPAVDSGGIDSGTVTPRMDAGTTTPAATGACGCIVVGQPSSASPAAVALLAIAGLAVWRRRRAR